VRKRTGLNLEDLDRGGLKRTALFNPSNVFKVAARGWNFDLFAASLTKRPAFPLLLRLILSTNEETGKQDNAEGPF
jgi:hypothetical protein